ncbi:MAG TPA: hypothetical protein VEU95_14580 [Micropepsaceae bacterium]|nr:hypothetical protein [Micropepsaceae bacterium]
MTRSFDELFAPKAMSLDELFAAIRPPPLLPVSYPPSDNSDFMSPSSGPGVNKPQPISQDRLRDGLLPVPPQQQNGALLGSYAPLDQYADITLNDFPAAVHGFGHVGIGINTDKTQGFYPRDDNVWTKLLELMGADVPGAVKYDDLSQPHRSVTMHTNSAQDAAARRYIDVTKSKPGGYNLYRRNCAGFCEGGLKAGGARAPVTGFPNALYDILNGTKPLDLPPGDYYP